MLKFIKILVFASFFSLSSSVTNYVSAAGAGTMYLQPDSMSVNIGNQFSTIVMVDASGSLIKSAIANFSYDNSKLKVLYVDIGSTFEADSGTTWNSSTITVSMSNSVAKPSDGELGTIYFEALSPGFTSVPFLNSSEIIDWEDDDILVMQPGGSFTVNEPAEDPDEGGGGGTGSGGGESGGGTEAGSNSSTEASSTTGSNNETSTSGSNEQNTSQTAEQEQAAGFSDGESTTEETIISSKKDEGTNPLPYIIGVGGAGLGIAAYIAFDKFRLPNGAKKRKNIDGYNPKPVKTDLPPAASNEEPIDNPSEVDIPADNRKPAAGTLDASPGSSSGRTADFPLNRQSGQITNSEVPDVGQTSDKPPKPSKKNPTDKRPLTVEERNAIQMDKFKKASTDYGKKPGAGTLNAGPGSTGGRTADFPKTRQSG